MQVGASIVDGLLLGFVYGVVAMGMTLIWGVMRVINLSQGAVMALGMFGVYLLFTGLGINPYLAILIVAVAGLLLGLLIYAGAVNKVIGAPYLSTLLATYAVSMLIIGLGTATFTTSPRSVNLSLGSIGLGPVAVPTTRVVAALVSVALAGGLQMFLYHSQPGRMIRAVSNNRAAAELTGIPTTSMLALAFGIGTMLAAVAGGLIATFFPFTILTGDTYQSKAFVIAVLGGLGNPIGALVGGLVLGLLEGIIPVFLPTSWVPVLEYGLFVVILLLRPNGLMGAKK